MGAKGMTLVVFQQDIGAPKTIYGPVTGTAYEFGGRRKVGRADNRDLRTNNLRNPGLLEMYDHGKPLFKETADPGAPPAKRKVAPPVEPVKEPEVYTAEEEEAVGTRIIEEEDVPQLVCDPGERTVKDIRELSGRLSPEQWKAMLELELEGKHRASAITFMESAIENLAG